MRSPMVAPGEEGVSAMLCAPGCASLLTVTVPVAAFPFASVGVMKQRLPAGTTFGQLVTCFVRLPPNVMLLICKSADPRFRSATIDCDVLSTTCGPLPLTSFATNDA